MPGCGSRTGLYGAGLDSDASAEPPTDAPDLADSEGDCASSGLENASYLLDGAGVLYRYDPQTHRHHALGVPDCGNDNIAWTMTASRENAYILYTDWTLYAVDLTTLACNQTPFQSGQLGIDFEFGIAVASVAGEEKLFVYGRPDDEGPPILAVSDLESFTLTEVGEISPAPPSSSYPVNLTADAHGNVFAFSPDGRLQHIDSGTAAVLDSAMTPATTGGTWAQLVVSGTDDFLFVDDRVFDYDFGDHTTLFHQRDRVEPIGGNTVFACP
jgi:hypothetical protein